MAEDGADLRRQLVADLRRRGHVQSEAVAGAVAAVPRELFVADHARRHGLEAVYRDEAIVTRRDPDTGRATSSSSQPAIMAEMLELLGARPGDRVLEIGAGSGYNAALLGRIVGPEGAVTSVELDAEVAAGARRAAGAAGAANVAVVTGDGHAGWPAAAPVHGIIVTASSDTVPRAWFHQLRPGGRLVVPLRLSPLVLELQVVVGLCKVRNGFDPVATVLGGFMALRDPDPGPAAGDRHGAAVAYEEADARVATPLVTLRGPALSGLDRAARRRLLVTALGFGRSEPLDIGLGAAWSLFGYAALALPEPRQVTLARAADRARGRQALGVVDAVDGSLAALAIGLGGTGIEAWGGRGAERALRATIERWELAGAPSLADAAVTVRYGPVRPAAWWCARRGDQWIAVDWPSGAPEPVSRRGAARRSGRR